MAKAKTKTAGKAAKDSKPAKSTAKAAKADKASKNGQAERELKTQKFVIYLLRESAPGKTEGWIFTTDQRGKITDDHKELAFDHLDEIGAKIRKLLKAEGHKYAVDNKGATVIVKDEDKKGKGKK